MWRKYCALVLSLGLVLSCVNDAQAAKTKSKKKKRTPEIVAIVPEDVFEVDVSIKSGKKQRLQRITCLDLTPGVVSRKKGKLVFQSYSNLVKKLTRSKGSRAKIAQYKALNSKGKPACTKPDFLSLERYTGNFGADEARLLCERFAFGCAPDQVNELVSLGLERAVDKLMTYVDEPVIDALEKQYACYGKPKIENEDPQADCDPFNANDFELDFLGYGMTYRFAYGANPFFYKLFMWVHDERMATNTRVLTGDDRYALNDHLKMIWDFTKTGDYRAFAHNYLEDHFGHFRWLSGATNKFYANNPSINEDMAREASELLTVGVYDLDGKPNYDDEHVRSAALALSGRGITCANEFPDPDRPSFQVRMCRKQILPQLHAPGPKTIFPGTPYQKVVYDSTGSVEIETSQYVDALLDHPMAANDLARDLWKHYLNSHATSPSTGEAGKRALQELGSMIRGSDYNLRPALKRMMMSRALYAPRSLKTILKPAVDKLISFVRITGIPAQGFYYGYDTLFDHLGHMGQQPLRAPTVFGWNEKNLASERYIEDFRGAINDILGRNTDLERIYTIEPDDDQDTIDWKTRANAQNTEINAKKKLFSYQDHFLAGLDQQPFPYIVLVQSLSDQFNLHLNNDQIKHLGEFLRNSYRTECVRYQNNLCVEDRYLVEADEFDPRPSNSEESEWKLKGLLSIMLSSAEFQAS